MQTWTGSFVLALAFAGLLGCSKTDRTGHPSSQTGGAGDETGGSGAGSGGSGAGPGGSGGSGGKMTAPSGGSGGSVVPTGGTAGSNRPDPDAAPPADSGAPDTGTPPSETPGPSAGCGKANPPVGRRMISTGVNNQSFWVALPPGYDPAKPYPLGFAFHGFGLNDKTCHDGSECPGFRTDVGAKAITVFPKSISAGWEYPVVYLPQNVKYVEDLIALMKREYCVDDSRIFVSGVSSGGHFVHHLSCQLGDRLWAAVPIAAYLEPAARTDCKGAPPQLHIRGITDSLKKGQDARDFQAMRNGCPTPPPGLAAMETEVLTAFQTKVTPPKTRCLSYEGCAKNPLRYCVFSQVTYNGGTHGWPDDGGKLIAEFLGTLK